VTQHVATVPEWAAAVLADERVLASVCSDVGFEMVFLCEAFAAVGTLEPFERRVDVRVTDEVALASELFVAARARE